MEWTDERVERVMGRLLQVGVIAAATVVLAGGILYLIRHGGEPADGRVFKGEPAAFTSPVGIVRETLAFSGRGTILFGLLLLIATPVARVLFSAFAFARQRDWAYVAFTLLVLAILLYGLIGS
ncbi:MAG TPA: DUF1634 domain-containing protein [Gemmataceae bacterium]